MDRPSHNPDFFAFYDVEKRHAPAHARYVSNEESQNGLTNTERTLRARIGGYRLHALYDTMVVSTPGRRAAADSLEARLLAEVDPDDSLPPAERAARLARARKAHFTQLAYRSARARSRRTQKADGSTY